MKIRIIAPSDGVGDETWWADYWVKKDLEREFTRQGHKIGNCNPDLDFYLYGNASRFDSMSAPLKFCWIYSHPNSFPKKLACLFDHIFVLSKSFLPHIPNSSLLIGGSSKKFIPRKQDPKYDIVFVGNAGKPLRIQVINHLIESHKYKICLAGTGWPQRLKNKIKKIHYAGPYVQNSELGQFFNQGLLSFYSSHDDMRRHGFIAVRLFDVFRSSENLCISEYNPGLKDVFRAIPTFENPVDLVDWIDWFLRYPKERERIALSCRQDVEQWSFTKVVNEVLKWAAQK